MQRAFTAAAIRDSAAAGSETIVVQLVACPHVPQALPWSLSYPNEAHCRDWLQFWAAVNATGGQLFELHAALGKWLLALLACFWSQ